MDARVTLSPEVAYQESLEHKILRWIQSHQWLVNSTSCRGIAICAKIPGYKTGTVQIAVQKMVNNQMLNRYGTKRKGRFRINYLHRDIPQDILDNAPIEEKAAVAKIKARLAENQHLDEVGCVITETPSETHGEAPRSDETAEDDIDTVSAPIVAQKASSEPTEQVIEVTKNGQPITITLTININ